MAIDLSQMYVTQHYTSQHNGVEETHVTFCGSGLPFYAVSLHFSFFFRPPRYTKHQHLFSNGEYFLFQKSLSF